MNTGEAHVSYDPERKEFQVVIVENNPNQIQAGVGSEDTQKALIQVAYTSTRQEAVNLVTDTLTGKVRVNTVEYFLFELPEPFRTQAIIQTDDDLFGKPAKDMVDALTTAFDWRLSQEGEEYWIEFVQECYPDEVEYYNNVAKHERKFNLN